MYTVRLAYFENEVIACPTSRLTFYQLDKIVFFKDTLFVDVPEGGPYSYYGTLTLPLPMEFIGIEEWDINVERRLYYALGALGVIKGIASMYPTAER